MLFRSPIDGHDVFKIIEELNRLKQIKGPKFLHVITTKGKGLSQAENDQVTYHAPGKFDAATGNIHPKTNEELPPKFQDVFGLTILDLARKNKKIIGITPAMPTGSSLKLMMDEMPARAFDVGIAEQHAVTLAAGMATQGMVVFCNIYSTFLQRAYDQIIHDIALQNLPVIFCIDRAGLVGEDGATHHGVFDLSYLNCIPNMIIYAPIHEIDLANIMYTASLGLKNPIAIRYPRGRGIVVDWQEKYFGKYEKIKIGQAKCLKSGSRIAVLSTGTIGSNVAQAINRIKKQDQFSHYDFGFIKPLDTALLKEIYQKYDQIITVEENAIAGGFGSAINQYFLNNKLTILIKNIGIPDSFIEHGTVAELQKICSIDVDGLIKLFEKY